MRNIFLKPLIACALLIGACNNNESAHQPKEKPESATRKGSFGYDLNFLKQHDSVIILANQGETAQVVVSPKYQGKVFTSTADGINGKSFGWINYKAFTAPVDVHMNAYGGENRLWLGPEGGVFSVFFGKGSEMIFDNWKTPAPVDIEPWNIVMKRQNSVHLQKDMKLVNYAGTELSLRADREISILTRDNIVSKTGIKLLDSVKAVGYLAVNSIINKGTTEWDQKTGMPCIWMLDMFNPSSETTIIIPYKDIADTSVKIATTDYFGEIAPGRIKYNKGVLLFRADGKSRGKIGIGPNRAKPMAGSYDAENGILTITMFDVDPNGKYLNQEWNTAKPPFSGDAVNAYNDGPLKDGSQMGPFYEIESVSPAAFLKPGGMLIHNHYVFHFTGGKQLLDTIARKVLGISVIDIEKGF